VRPMIDMQGLPEPWLWALTGINMVACAAVMWACACRLSVTSRGTTKPQFINCYSLVFAAAFASGLSRWLWGEWPGPGQIAFALAVLYVIGTGMREWRRGPPDYARSAPGDFDATPHHHH